MYFTVLNANSLTNKNLSWIAAKNPVHLLQEDDWGKQKKSSFSSDCENDKTQQEAS